MDSALTKSGRTTALWNADSLIQAWRFAAEAHQGQRVPGTELPYLTHLGQVVMEVMGAVAVEPLANADLPILCAVLHDVIEDTAVTYEQVQAQFGLAVADGVLALTKDETLPTKAAQMEDSLARIKQQPRELWLVKLGDRIANLGQPPQHWTAEKIAAYREEAVKIHQQLGEASPLLGDRLLSKIAAYGAYL
jgi:(p)ppGpp synthase/HD superfamily hydrolase